MTTARVELAPTQTDAKGPGPRGVLGWLGQLLAWMVILAVAAVLAVAVGIPRLAGATPYTVLTGSMRPHLPPGTLVVVRPTDPHTIGLNQVVTYQLRSGEPEVVTHRVVTVGSDAHGRPIFQTQGDANNTPDPRWVRAVQVRGTVWYAVPYLGHVNTLLTGRQQQLAVTVVAAGLLGYAALMFAGAVRDRRRRLS